MEFIWFNKQLVQILTEIKYFMSVMKVTWHGRWIVFQIFWIYLPRIHLGKGEYSKKSFKN